MVIPVQWKAASAFFLIFLYSSSTVRGQFDDDTGMWLAVFGNDDLKLVENQELKLKWWFDSQLRFFDDNEGLQQTLLRPGIGIDLGESKSFWSGYAWIHNSPIGSESVDEHRLWQQWMWTPKHDLMSYVVRLRFEQRNVETGDEVGLRWRQFIRAQRSLESFPNLSIVTWDEMFFHLNDTDWGADTGFDQNRLFIGIGIKNQFSSRGRLEIGYLNQAINTIGPENRVNHILSLNYFY